MIEIVEKLKSKDNKTACDAMKMLQEESEKTDKVYKYFDVFSDMIHSSNSYIRNRGLILIASNAKWDKDNKIDEIIDDYLKHIADEKPITARQCIKYLPIIAKYKCDLRETIVNALKRADISKYKDSMQTLVGKDIRSTIKEIEQSKMD